MIYSNPVEFVTPEQSASVAPYLGLDSIITPSQLKTYFIKSLLINLPRVSILYIRFLISLSLHFFRKGLKL